MDSDLTQRQQKYLKDLAMGDYLRVQAELKSLSYDDRYTESEKSVIVKYLKGKAAMSDVIYNNKIQITPNEKDTATGIHGG